MKKRVKTVLYRAIDLLPFGCSNLIYKTMLKIRYHEYFRIINRLLKYRCSEKYLDSDMINNILIVRIDALGDMVWTTAFIREMKRNFPKVSIDMIVNQSIAPLLGKCPYVDNVIAYKARNIGKPNIDEYNDILRDTKIFVKKRCTKMYDITILPRNLYSGYNIDNIFIALQVRTRQRLAVVKRSKGIDNAMFELLSPYFTKLIQVEDDHCVAMMLNFLKKLGLDIEDRSMELWPSKYNFKESNVYTIGVGIVGSSANRNWNPNNYINVIKYFNDIYEDKIKFVIFGGKESIETASRIERKVECKNMAGKTNLNQLIDDMNGIDLYLGADTGLMHVAAALGKPIVEISSFIKGGIATDEGGNPAVCGPWKVESKILQPAVGLDGCTDNCLRDSHCINIVSSQEVIEAVLYFFEKYKMLNR